jgi:hypothetical protein
MTFRSLTAIVLCTVGLAALTAPGALAGPNGHANEHAQSNGNGGGGNGGENGNSGEAASSTSHSAVRQYTLANGLKQGDVAKSLKSWNSLNANPKAFLNNLDNPNSLKGKQAQYICDSAGSETALSSFTDLGGDVQNPPSEEAAADAQEYLAAVASLGDRMPADVIDDPESSPAEVAAAKLVRDSSLDADGAQAILDQRAAWLAYEGSAQKASDSFAAASVSYHGSTDLTALRKTVDGVIAQKGLDTSSLCDTSVAAAQ